MILHFKCYRGNCSLKPKKTNFRWNFDVKMLWNNQKPLALPKEPIRSKKNSIWMDLEREKLEKKLKNHPFQDQKSALEIMFFKNISKTQNFHMLKICQRVSHNMPQLWLKRFAKIFFCHREKLKKLKNQQNQKKSSMSTYLLIGKNQNFSKSQKSQNFK